MADKKKILFVCMGNICRSPSAEAVLRKMAQDRGLDLEVDSAGTIAYHAGEPADARMQRHALKRGYHLTSISRPIVASDFDTFDMIIAMDDANMAELEALAPSEAARQKLSLMTTYCTRFTHTSVPDPYYGGSEGFELVLDLIEDACDGLLEDVEA